MNVREKLGIVTLLCSWAFFLIASLLMINYNLHTNKNVALIVSLTSIISIGYTLLFFCIAITQLYDGYQMRKDNAKES